MIVCLALLLTCTFSLQAQNQKKANRKFEKLERKTDFEDFLKKFPVASWPFALETKKYDKANGLNWEFYQFIPNWEQMAEEQMTQISAMPAVRFEINGNHVVVLQIFPGRKTSFFQMYTFSKKGAFISTQRVTNKIEENTFASN